MSWNDRSTASGQRAAIKVRSPVGPRGSRLPSTAGVDSARSRGGRPGSRPARGRPRLAAMRPHRVASRCMPCEAEQPQRPFRERALCSSPSLRPRGAHRIPAAERIAWLPRHAAGLPSGGVPCSGSRHGLRLPSARRLPPDGAASSRSLDRSDALDPRKVNTRGSGGSAPVA